MTEYLNEYLALSSHGSRHLELKLDNSSHILIKESDNNIYLTFADLGESIYTSQFPIIINSLKDCFIKEKFYDLLENFKFDEGKTNELQNSLVGLYYLSFIERLLQIKNWTTKSTLKYSNLQYSDRINISEIYFNHNTFSKYDLKSQLRNENLKIMYDSLISEYKIDIFLDIIENRHDVSNAINSIPDASELLRKMIFSFDNNHLGSYWNMYFYISLYKLIIILIIYSMDNNVIPIESPNTDQFYLMLNNPHNKYEILLKSSLYFFHFKKIMFNEFIKKNNLYLKMYYKNKYIPNYYYSLYGYFDDKSDYIEKSGLRKLDDYINLFETNKLYKIIETLDSKNIVDEDYLLKGSWYPTGEYDDDGEPIETLITHSIRIHSIDYSTENYNYIIDNIDFMFDGTIDISYLKPIRIFELRNKFDCERLFFNKGNSRRLEDYFKDKYFGNNNVVILFSCAVDINEKTITPEVKTSLRTSTIARQIKYLNYGKGGIFINTSNNSFKNKYLKYKNKYLALKKKLNK